MDSSNGNLIRNGKLKLDSNTNCCNGVVSLNLFVCSDRKIIFFVVLGFVTYDDASEW